MFDFRSTRITALRGPIFLPPDLIYQNVLRLSLDDVNSLGIPRRIILKKEDGERSEDFENEIRIYERLQNLQGTIIPEYFGLASIEGVRALVLSDLGGIALFEEGMPHFEQDRLEEMLARPIRLIRQMGVYLSDLASRNIHWCGDEFRFMDFEDAKTVIEEAENDEADILKMARWLSENIMDRQKTRAKMAALPKLAARERRRRRKQLEGVPDKRDTAGLQP